jgi:hypothetical protein
LSYIISTGSPVSLLPTPQPPDPAHWVSRFEVLNFSTLEVGGLNLEEEKALVWTGKMVSRRSYVVFAALVAVIALAACAVQGVQGLTDAEKQKQDAKNAVEQDYDAWLAYWEAQQDAKDAAAVEGRRTSEVDSNSLPAGFATSMKKSSKKSSSKCSKTIEVEKNGKGDFKTIQAAVDSVKLNNKKRVCIKIAAGIY